MELGRHDGFGIGRGQLDGGVEAQTAAEAARLAIQPPVAQTLAEISAAQPRVVERVAHALVKADTEVIAHPGSEDLGLGGAARVRDQASLEVAVRAPDRGFGAFDGDGFVGDDRPAQATGQIGGRTRRGGGPPAALFAAFPRRDDAIVARGRGRREEEQQRGSDGKR